MAGKNRIRWSAEGPAANNRTRGFTLLEAAAALVIVSTGVLALIAAQQAVHRQNDWAQRSATAMLLANEIRELTLSLPLHDPITGKTNLGPEPGELTVAAYNDVDDFAGVVVDGVGQGTTFDPPINALRQPIADMAGWSQEVRVFSVPATNISTATPPALGATDLMRVRVTVRYRAPQDAEPRTITQLTWIVGR